MVIKVIPTVRVKYNAEQAMAIDNSALQDVVRAADQQFRANEKELFSTEGASGGERWKELSPLYKMEKDAFFGTMTRARNKEMRMRQKAYPDKATRSKIPKPQRLAENKILQFSGHMKRAFSTAGEGHVAKGVLQGGGRFEVQLGAQGEVYFSEHFTGSGVPVRNPIQMTQKQKGEYVNVIMPAIIPHLMRRVKMKLAGA